MNAWGTANDELSPYCHLRSISYSETTVDEIAAIFAASEAWKFQIVCWFTNFTYNYLYHKI